MALRSLPAFQRALLKRQAQSVGAGRAVMQTDDISGKYASEILGRQIAFGNIAQSRDARMERNRQFGKRLDMDQSKLRDTERELPWRIGLGLAGAGLATYQGRERNKILQQQMESQMATNTLMTDMLNKGKYKATKERIMGIPTGMNHTPGLPLRRRFR